MNYIPGAGRDLASAIEAHLFVVCPNNSGSSFLGRVDTMVVWWGWA